MPAQVTTDKYGTTYVVPADDRRLVTPDGHRVPGCPALQVWWGRAFSKDKRDETLLICQANNQNSNDVVQLTLGQVYDLIDALGLAVVRK